jgi:hypothetical protein
MLSKLLIAVHLTNHIDDCSILVRPSLARYLKYF